MHIWKKLFKWMSDLDIGTGVIIFILVFAFLIFLRDTLNLGDTPFFSEKYIPMLVLFVFLFFAISTLIKKEIVFYFWTIKGVPAIAISILFILGLIFVIAQFIIYGKIIY